MIQSLSDDAVSLFERRFHVSAPRGVDVGDVSAELFVNERRVPPGRLLGVGDDVERVVIDLDQVGGVAGLVFVSRDDGGDGLSDEDDFARGEHWVFWDFQFGQRGGAGDVADLALDVFAGVNGDHAGRVFSRVNVNRIDTSVGVRAAQYGDAERAGDLDVVDVMADALDQARVFCAFDFLSDIFRQE